VEDERRLQRTCPHCEASCEKHLGHCERCGEIVCEHCGNSQFVRGERHIYHTTCLKKDGGKFTMIRFVD